MTFYTIVSFEILDFEIVLACWTDDWFPIVKGVFKAVNSGRELFSARVARENPLAAVIIFSCINQIDAWILVDEVF